MTLTRFEGLVLNAVARDLYNPANGGFPASFEDDIAAVWTFSVADSTRAFLAATSLPGVVSSLAKKGLVTVGGTGDRRSGDDFYIDMTATGFAAWQAAFPTEAASDAALKMEVSSDCA